MLNSLPVIFLKCVAVLLETEELPNIRILAPHPRKIHMGTTCAETNPEQMTNLVL